jgi:hypothetical protein
LVVEGPSDARLVDRLAPKEWVTFPAGTRNAVVETVREVWKASLPRVAGLVDPDFDDYVYEARREGAPVFFYENADLEAVLILGQSFDTLLGELASAEKLARFGGVEPLRLLAVRAATELAALRRESRDRGWGLPFDSIDTAGKVHTTDLTLKAQPYCQALLDKADTAVDRSEVLSVVLAARENAPDAQSLHLAYFRGKDALAVVGVALRRAVGTCVSGVTTIDHLSRLLRLCATQELLQTAPFKEMAEFLNAS